MDRRQAYRGYSPPSFMRYLTDLHARYGHLEEAIASEKRQIELRQECRRSPEGPDERRAALHGIATHHQRIADLFLLLADDMAAWEEWHAKSVELRQRAEGG